MRLQVLTKLLAVICVFSGIECFAQATPSEALLVRKMVTDARPASSSLLPDDETVKTLLEGVKREMVGRYPRDADQINMVGLPTIGYRTRAWFNWRLFHFQAGRCDLFKSPQVIVARSKNFQVLIKRLRHEMEHFVILAAGLTDRAHASVDNRRWWQF